MESPKQYWRISVKGYNAQVFKDSSIGHRHDGTSYQDTTYGYGYVFFYGTEDECGDKEMELFRLGFKILGSEADEFPPGHVELKKKVRSLCDRAYEKLRKITEHNERLHWGKREIRYPTMEEKKAKAVADRIYRYYNNKFIFPYITKWT